VTFSPGAHDLIDADIGDQTIEEDHCSSISRYIPGTTAEDIERAATDPDYSVSDLLEAGPTDWTLDGVGIVDESGETCHDVEHSSISFVQIDGAEYLDPPNVQPSYRPQPRYSRKCIIDY
jgi:hypothetical protein